ncbi:MAG TPA: hypothetical protein VK736_08325 [Candidatus Binatia bacterium]|nr:hypothetical protein [Candidatus Binatia bacterium]
MADEPYQPVADEAIDELIATLRPVVAGAPEDATLEQVLALPEAKQVVAKWGAKHEVIVLAPRRKVASWLVGALLRRGLDSKPEGGP